MVEVVGMVRDGWHGWWWLGTVMGGCGLLGLVVFVVGDWGCCGGCDWLWVAVGGCGWLRWLFVVGVGCGWLWIVGMVVGG